MLEVKELVESGEFLEGLQKLEPYMKADPMNTMGLFLLGQIMLETDKQSIAYPLYKLVTQQEPKRPEAWINMGKAAGELHRYEEEEVFFKKALKLAKQQNNENCLHLATQNLGTCAVHSCNPDKAVYWAKKALALKDTRQSRIDIGYAYLSMQNFKEGWEYYNDGIGFQLNRDKRQYFDEPEWDGSPGKRLILYGEQGLGDQIAFAEAVRDVRKMSKSVTLHVTPKLPGLLARSLVLPTFSYGEDADQSWQSPVDASASIARIQQYVRDDIDKFTGKPFLIADPNRRIQWRALFDSMGDRLKVGIAWTGGSHLTQEVARSTSLENLLPILKSDVDWISLEYNDKSEEINAFTAKHGIKIHDYPWATRTKDYDDTAGLVAELDLVISIPTSVVHLAGGLGIPCWCMVHPHPHFMFGLQGEKMPLYKSVKLFRRAKDWDILDNVKGTLDEFILRHHNSGGTGALRFTPTSGRVGEDSLFKQGAVY